ncbi:MAG: cysteine desulfurase [Planctomycetota bacterium]|jgi:cysteine desulfurase
MLPEVRERYLELLDMELGNPSSSHSSGRRARAVIDDSRAEVAGAIGVSEESIVFTSGGTEANNLALRGAQALSSPSSGIAISAVEHPSVLEPAQEIARAGHSLLTLPVDSAGCLELGALEEALATPNLAILSVMTANNEVGTVMPMEEIAECLERSPGNRPIWHTDSVQALGRIPLALTDWGVDMASFSGHKVGGPLGVGFLIRKRAFRLPALQFGGGQESGLRAGTENAAGIGATSLAVTIACREQPEYEKRLCGLTRELYEGLRSLTEGVRILGPDLDQPNRLPNTLNLLFDGVDGRALIARLDLEGIEASLGSACSSGAIEASHVLLAMGLDERSAQAGLRLSLGKCTTHLDIHSAVDILGKVILRST